MKHWVIQKTLNCSVAIIHYISYVYNYFFFKYIIIHIKLTSTFLMAFNRFFKMFDFLLLLSLSSYVFAQLKIPIKPGMHNVWKITTKSLILHLVRINSIHCWFCRENSNICKTRKNINFGSKKFKCDFLGGFLTVWMSDLHKTFCYLAIFLKILILNLSVKSMPHKAQTKPFQKIQV